MNTTTVPTDSGPRRLQGTRLTAGRVLYGTLLLLCVAVFATSLYANFVLGVAPCDSVYNVDWSTCPEWFAAINGLGLTPELVEGYFLFLRVVAAIPYFGLSLLLARRRSREVRVLLLAALLPVLGVAGTWFNPLWGWADAWFVDYAALPQLTWAPRVLTFLLYGGGLLFTYLFPDGRFLHRWQRYLAAAGLLLVAGYAFFPETPLSWGTWPTPMNTVLGLILTGSMIYTLVDRYRAHADALQRQQIKWVVAGLLLMILNFLVDFGTFNIYPALTGDYPLAPGMSALLWELIQDTAWYVSQFFFAVCVGLAIFHYRLWDVDNILSRALVYGGLTGIIITLYVLIVGGLGALFQVRFNPFLGLVATSVVAVLFQPLRQGLQWRVSRLLYGQRADPAAVLRQLAQNIDSAHTSEAILDRLAATVAEALKIPHAAIWLRTSEHNDASAHSERFERAVSWGRSTEEVEFIPLTYQKQEIGRLVVAPRTPGEPFEQADRQLLDTIARLTSTTVHAVQLSSELNRSRQRIVVAREEERRRLRRDLHDGLGPQLASQTLGLEAIGKWMEKDPDKARSLLETLQEQAQEAILDVRRLVYELRPPALDELGLVGALRESAARYESDRLRFSFEVRQAIPELPAATEVAAYRIIQEAMTNVVRHAGATHCKVQLWVEKDALILEVRDDGRGIEVGQRAGVGLQSMRERAAELNGRCVVEPEAESGTRVRAKLPLKEE